MQSTFSSPPSSKLCPNTIGYENLAIKLSPNNCTKICSIYLTGTPWKKQGNENMVLCLYLFQKSKRSTRKAGQKIVHICVLRREVGSWRHFVSIQIAAGLWSRESKRRRVAARPPQVPLGRSMRRLISYVTEATSCWKIRSVSFW